MKFSALFIALPSFLFSLNDTHTRVLASRDPFDQLTKDLGDDHPTASPTVSPSAAPTSPPSAPKGCQLDVNGNYGDVKPLQDDNDSISIIEITFNYEVQMEESFDENELLKGIEDGIANLIIESAITECRTDRRGIRRLGGSKLEGDVDIVGVTSAPADKFITGNDGICKELPEKCKVVKGGFKIHRKKPKDTYTETEEYQVVGAEGSNEGSVSDADMETSIRDLINVSMSSLSGSLGLISGVIALHYLGNPTFSASISSNADDVYTMKDRGDVGLIISIVLVFAAFAGMLAIGTLMKRKRDRNDNDEERVHFARNHDTPYECLSNSSIQSGLSSYWGRGWTNVTRTYDEAVEVCMERVNSFRRDSEQVDSFRRGRNEFI